MVASELPLKLKLFRATVHGHGTYFFYYTEQVKNNSDSSLEVLQRVHAHVLLKYEQEKGVFPSTFQLNNGPDQKITQF